MTLRYLPSSTLEWRPSHQNHSDAGDEREEAHPGIHPVPEHEPGIVDAEVLEPEAPAV